MRTRSKLVVLSLCLVYLSCFHLSAQEIGKTLFSLPPSSVPWSCIKHFEGLHSWKDYPYVGYGHRLQPGERFTAAMTERRADSLLRADLMKRFASFQRFGKDALLLTVLSLQCRRVSLLGKLASDRRVSLSENWSWEIGIFTVNMSRSADTRVKSSEVLSNGERWNLPCFMYPDFTKYAPCKFYRLARGRFLSVLFVFLAMNE